MTSSDSQLPCRKIYVVCLRLEGLIIESGLVILHEEFKKKSVPLNLDHDNVVKKIRNLVDT